jgi:hypothetical protein
MDNAELKLRFRKYGGDSIRKSGQTINTGDKNILDAPILKLSQHKKAKTLRLRSGQAWRLHFRITKALTILYDLAY